MCCLNLCRLYMYRACVHEIITKLLTTCNSNTTLWNNIKLYFTEFLYHTKLYKNICWEASKNLTCLYYFVINIFHNLIFQSDMQKIIYCGAYLTHCLQFNWFATWEKDAERQVCYFSKTSHHEDNTLQWLPVTTITTFLFRMYTEPCRNLSRMNNSQQRPVS